MSKYGHLPHDFFEGLLNKMGGEERAKAFLRGDLDLVEEQKKWRVDARGIIYFSVTSDGTTGEGWIKRLEDNGFGIGDYAERILESGDLEQTSGVTTEVAVLPGRLFKDKDRSFKNIRANAAKRKFEIPNAEVACLIREKFTDRAIKKMGLSLIIVMHKHIDSSDKGPGLLSAYGDHRLLRAYHERPDRKWFRDCGFAFAVSQKAAT